VNLNKKRITARRFIPAAPLVGCGRGAAAGEILSMYTSGASEGNVIPPQVSIGAKPSEIVFWRYAPGIAASLR
jgi:hypothetical protein